MSHRFSIPQGPFKLDELAQSVGAELYNTKGVGFLVSDLAPLSHARADHLSMLHQKKYIKMLKNSQAGGCILAPEYVDYAPKHMHLLVHENPYKAYALIAQIFYPSPSFPEYLAPSAFVAPTAKIGKGCHIAHGAYIGNDVDIGEGCKIGVNAFIDDGVVMGDDCCIENNVSISHTIMGNHVLVYPGARIGQDGFGFASDENGHYKIPQTGGVLIGNNVEIGANTCIDRGSMTDTEIADWCRIDNLVQIGHNVKIGKGSILCGQVGIAGSSKIGEHVTLAGQVGVSSHISVGDRVTVLVGSTAVQSIASDLRVGGYPAVQDRDWHKQTYFLKKHSKARTS